MAFEISRINRFPQSRTLSLIKSSPALNKVAVKMLPISTQLRLGISAPMTISRAIKVLRTPVNDIFSIEAKVAAQGRLSIFAKRVFFAPVSGLEAAKAAIGKARDFFKPGGFAFGMEPVLISAEPSRTKMPSFLLFFESSGENKKEFEVSSEDSLGEVIYKVFGKQAKRVALVAELAKVDGAMDALETLLGDKFDAEVENNAALSDLLLNLSAAKEGAIVSLTKLGPFGEDQEVIAKLKGEISKLNEFIIAKNKELKDKNDLILQIKQELNDKNIMIDAYQATQAGKERDKAEKLTQELAAANLAINELKEELKKSAPILSENAALREDLRLILTFIGEKDKSKVDTKDLQTDLGRQLADIVLPMLQEISELKQLRSITITGLEGQADLIKKAVEHIKNSLMAEIHSIEGTNAAKNNSIEDLNEQNAKLFEELQGYRARFDAYNALTAGIMDFGELLKKAKSRRLTKIEIRERAAGLEKVLEKLQASSGGEVEALIPELLNKMVYKLIELIQKEEMMKEMATLTVKLKMLCEEHKIDFSKVRVVSAQTGVEEGLDEALKALDTEGDFI